MIKPFTPEELKSMRIWDAEIDREESNRNSNYKRKRLEKEKARAATQADANGTNINISHEAIKGKVIHDKAY